MQLFLLYDRIFTQISAALGDWFITTLARFAFVAVLFHYYWNSALTKIGDGFFGFLTVTVNGYAQMFPKQMEAVLYDSASLNIILKLIGYAGTWAEFVLPVLILIGLFSRLAALGMIGFILVQTLVDITGHGAELGGWFDRFQNGLIDERTLWIFILLITVSKGAGPISLDRLLGRV